MATIKLPRAFVPKFKYTLSQLEGLASSGLIKEIYLFGSCAREEAMLDSDLDFLVIPTKNTTCHKLSLLIEERDLRDDIGYPNVDIVVRDELCPDDLEFGYYVAKDCIKLWG